MAKSAKKIESQPVVVARPYQNIRPWDDLDVKEEIISEIIRRISDGETLTRICRTEGFPAAARFLFWVQKDPHLAKQYARAMEIRADINAETIVDIADEDTNIARARNRIDARRWHNEKLAPKKYGAKVLTENYNTVNIRQKVDFNMVPADVRQKLKDALMKQIDLVPNKD